MPDNYSYSKTITKERPNLAKQSALHSTRYAGHLTNPQLELELAFGRRQMLCFLDGKKKRFNVQGLFRNMLLL